MLQIILFHMLPRKCGNSRLCIAMYTIVLITKRNNRNTIECHLAFSFYSEFAERPKNRQFNPFYFFFNPQQQTDENGQKPMQLFCRVGIEALPHAPDTRPQGWHEGNPTMAHPEILRIRNISTIQCTSRDKSDKFSARKSTKFSAGKSTKFSARKST